MKIDGKLIAQQILEDLKKKITSAALHPTLAVIQVGENPASLAYIHQKQKAAEFIGAKILIKNIKILRYKDIKRKIIKTIGELNKNKQVHGLIVQLPLPFHLDLTLIQSAIDPRKDVDGFTPGSPFMPPVASAVLKVLENIKAPSSKLQFLVIGRGITAGKPIAETLKKLNYQVTVAHSQTLAKDQRLMTKNADVIISCVGKANILKAEMFKQGAIVIGVGLHRTPEGKLAGDFNEEEISKVASFYTPTPGGLGPINVACLMENLTKTLGV